MIPVEQCIAFVADITTAEAVFEALCLGVSSFAFGVLARWMMESPSPAPEEKDDCRPAADW